VDRQTDRQTTHDNTSHPSLGRNKELKHDVHVRCYCCRRHSLLTVTSLRDGAVTSQACRSHDGRESARGAAPVLTGRGLRMSDRRSSRAN